MPDPVLYRRRFIPEETVLLKDDVITYQDQDVIITKWSVLKPRKDFAFGSSCYFLNRGFKVSKILDKDNNFLYYYCDIIETVFNEKDNTYVFNDLLVDVIVYDDGKTEVRDLGEFSEALDKKLITIDLVKTAMVCVDELLAIIYKGDFNSLTCYFEKSKADLDISNY